MIPRFAPLWVVLICIAGALEANANGDPQELASEKAKAADIQRGFAHVNGIKAPKRTIAAGQIGRQYQAVSGAEIVAIGNISESSIRSILEQIEERDVPRAKTVTGDEQYAVLEVGDRARDPCCFATALLSKRDGIWIILTGSRVSH